MRISTPGNGVRCLSRRARQAPRPQPGARHEAEFGGAVVFEDGGIGCPAPGRLEGPGIQFGTGADDAADAGRVDPSGQAALAEQPEHGGHQDQPGDAVVADGGVGVADVEVLQGVKFRPGVQALGQGIEVQARGERAGGQGFVLLAKAEELNGGVERILPRLPGAGECFRDRGGAGGQSDEERGAGRPVSEPRPAPDTCAGPGGVRAIRAAIASRSCCGQAGSSTAHWRSPATAAANATAKRIELCSDKTVTAGAEGTSAAALSRSPDQVRCAPATTTAVSSGRSSAQRWSLSRNGIDPTLPLPSGRADCAGIVTS